MVRKTNWSRRFPHPITPLDGPPLTELRDVAQYMLGIGDRHHRQHGSAWPRSYSTRPSATDPSTRHAARPAREGARVNRSG
jgi:hypothetical protein